MFEILKSPVTVLVAVLTVAVGYQTITKNVLEHKVETYETKLGDTAEKLRDANSKVGEAKNRIAHLNTVVDTMQQQINKAASDAADLAQTQEDLLKDASVRENLIKRLKRENEDLKKWADTPLPPTVVQLRKRPAIRTAKDYQNWLRQTDALHPSPERASDERGPQ